MTKRNFNLRAAALLIGVFFGGNALAVPFMVLAQGGTATGGTASGENPANFCSRLLEVKSKVNGGLADRTTKLAEARTARDGKLDAGQADRDAKLADTRAKADANRQDHYAKLLEKADTDAKKQAVQTFRTAVEAAVAARRAAIDEAIKTFRQGVDGAITARKAAVDTAVNTFTASVNAATAKADTDCAGKVAPRTARETFQASLRAAREKLRTGRQALEKRKDVVTPLRTERKAAVDKAIADFKAAVEAAKNTLKAALGGN